MAKFSVDFEKLDNKLLKKSYKLSDVKDKLEVLAWDIVRFKDADKGADLWQIQSSDDGDYIVSLYEEDLTKTASSKVWEVVLSKTAKTLNVFYKGDPIVVISASKLGIPETELTSIENYLPKKLSENKILVKALLKELPESAKNEVLNRYPELV